MIIRSLVVCSVAALALSLTACANDTSSDDGPAASEDALTNRARAGGRFETFKGEDGKSYFRLVAANGLKLLRSEAYAGSSGPDGAIESMMKGAQQNDERRFVVAEAATGFYVNVLGAGASTEVIGTSEVYSSRSNAERAQKAIMGYLKGIARVAYTPAETGERFQIFKIEGEAQPFKFLLRAANGETILSSEFYASKQSAEEGIKAVKDYGRLASNFEVIEVRDGRAVFSLKAIEHSAVGGGGRGNNSAVGFSEVYASKSNAERGAAAVQDVLAGDIDVQDLSQ